ncbi:MAG: hypothetical protein ACFFBP_02655 [Promethearchaeota archaeon]
MEHIEINIPSSKSINDVVLKTIGIDVGHTLTKIAFIEGNELILILMKSQRDFNELIDLLDTKQEKYENLNFTGGRAFKIYRELSPEFNTSLYNEFNTNYLGIGELYSIIKNKKLPTSLIISIGTGTSIVSKEESVKHLGGTALGGGFFMGMINLLYNITDFHEAIELAYNGNRYEIDLKVSDIYDKEDDRVDSLFKEFTAASFAKVDDSRLLKKEDVINSLIHLIAENIGMLSCFMADKENLINLVFCGGFTIENKILKKALSRICMIQQKKAIFLKNAAYMGAIGALFIN